MGTRADFYIRKDGALKWLGSVALDGYDVDEAEETWATRNDRGRACWALKNVETESDFTAALQFYFEMRDDVTDPVEHGWPWPWEDSRTTDYAYVFEGNKLRRFAWGKEIIPGDDESERPEPDGGWPDMTNIQDVTLGTRSGVILVG